MCDKSCSCTKSEAVNACSNKPNTNDFSVAKVGDKVWAVGFGDGKVVAVNLAPSRTYVIDVTFSCNDKIAFTVDGRYSESWKTQSLFWSNPNIIAPAHVEPLPDLKVDDKVFVWNDCGIPRVKYNRHFAFFKNGKIHCYDDGQTSSTTSVTTYWENYEVVDGKKN